MRLRDEIMSEIKKKEKSELVQMLEKLIKDNEEIRNEITELRKLIKGA